MQRRDFLRASAIAAASLVIARRLGAVAAPGEPVYAASPAATVAPPPAASA